MSNLTVRIMNKIKQDCDDLRKIGLQMTGIMTTISVSGMTSDKMQMLITLNEEITQKTNTIVSEAGKISQSLKDSNFKIRGLKKDLQAANKNLFDAQHSQRMLELQLKETKDELNTSKRAVDELFSDDLFPGDEPKTSTPKGKQPLNTNKKAAIKKSSNKEPTKVKDTEEKRRESEKKEKKETRQKRREPEKKTGEASEQVAKKVKADIETAASDRTELEEKEEHPPVKDNKINDD